MFDVAIVDGQIKLIVMLFDATAVLRSSVGQDSQHRQPLSLIERQYAIIEQIGGSDRRFTRIQLAVGDFRVGIHERLLVDTPHAFQIANVEGILRPQITRTAPLTGGIPESHLRRRWPFTNSQYASGELVFSTA